MITAICYALSNHLSVICHTSGCWKVYVDLLFCHDHRADRKSLKLCVMCTLTSDLKFSPCSRQKVSWGQSETGLSIKCYKNHETCMNTETELHSVSVKIRWSYPAAIQYKNTEQELHIVDKEACTLITKSPRNKVLKAKPCEYISVCPCLKQRIFYHKKEQ